MGRAPSREAHQLNLVRARYIELQHLLKKLLKRYPAIENNVTAVEWKILKDNNILGVPEEPDVKNPCRDCGIECGHKSRCSKCYMKWKKAKRSIR